MNSRIIVIKLAFLFCAVLAVATLSVCGTTGTATGPEETDGASDHDRGVNEGHDDTGQNDTGGITPKDTGHPKDSGTADDVPGDDTGGLDVSPSDTGMPDDTGTPDAGTPVDTGNPVDTGTPADTGTPIDTGTPVDTGHPADTGHPVDTGHPDSGVADTGHPVDGGGTCTIDTGMPACNTCLATQCTSQCTTCQGNPACLDVLACGLGCDINDATCLENCATQNPGGAADGANLYNCVSDHCLMQCASVSDAGPPADAGVLPDIGHLPDGGSVLCAMQWGNQTCTTCYQSACSSQCQACAGNYDCVLALTCIAQCPQGDTTCMYGCVQQYHGSFSLIMAMYNCVNGSCKTQCGL